MFLKSLALTGYNVISTPYSGRFVAMVTANDKYQHLAALLLSGNELDYARFLNAIAPVIRRMVAKRVPSAEVEDVVQEVLISIHKARHTYDGNRPIMPWLAAIARFRMTDYLRKHYSGRRHQEVDIAELHETLADVTAGNDSNESVEELLDGVPAHAKKILSMMHVEGYTAKEVGTAMNMNESAVKVAAHRAIKKIREKLNG